MARKSKLSEAQWAEVDRRLLEGESPTSIAKDYKVTPTAIRQRKLSRTDAIVSVANQIVSTEKALSALPITSQKLAQTFAMKLQSLSDHMLGAATYGAATAHRLHGIAHEQVQKIDDAKPLAGESMETLKNVAVITKVANDAGAMGAAILAANKEVIKEANSGKEDDPSKFLADLAELLPD